MKLSDLCMGLLATAVGAGVALMVQIIVSNWR